MLLNIKHKMTICTRLAKIDFKEEQQQKTERLPGGNQL